MPKTILVKTSPVKNSKVKASLGKRPTRIDVISPTIPDDEFDQDEKGAIKDGLPWQAFAMVPDKGNPSTWKLPHHTRQVYRAVKGKIGYEHTVDWDNMSLAAQYLSRFGIDGQRVTGEPSDLLAAARHLAGHYLKAGKSLPDALAVIV